MASFNQSFNIKQQSGCKSVQLCDTTCLVNHYNKQTCCDGYGVEGNIALEDIDHTRFHFQLPDGQEFFDVDLEWVHGTKAQGSFQVTGGTNGVIVVDVAGTVLGQTVFVTDIDTTVGLLTQSINSIAEDTLWQAYLLDGTTDTVVIEAINYGIEFNDKAITVSVSEDITVSMITDPTTGANGFDNCFCYTVQDIYGINNCPPTNDFPDGVHTVTYILYNDQGEELSRVTNNFLFTCRLKCKINNLILLPAEDKCACSDKFDERLVELRLMLEKAEVQMRECLYDCVDETITKAHKFADGICLDC